MINLTPQLFTAEDVPATVYHLGLYRQFGPDIYTWEPHTLWLEIKDDFGVDPSQEVKDKIQAVCTVNHIDYATQDCIPFRSTILALNHTDPQFDYAGGLDIPELAWGLIEIKRNCNYSPNYSDEVKKYVHVCLEGNHYLGVPKDISKCINIRYNPDVDKRISALPEVQEQEHFRQNRVAAYVMHNEEVLREYLRGRQD